MSRAVRSSSYLPGPWSSPWTLGWVGSYHRRRRGRWDRVRDNHRCRRAGRQRSDVLPVRRDPVRGLLSLRRGAPELTGADERVRLVLEPVLGTRAERVVVVLWPEVLDAVRSADLERDQVVELVAVRHAGDPVERVDLVLPALRNVPNALRLPDLADRGLPESEVRARGQAMVPGSPRPGTGVAVVASEEAARTPSAPDQHRGADERPSVVEGSHRLRLADFRNF